MKKISILFLSILFSIQSIAQENQEKRDPYKLRLGIDLPLTVGLYGTSLLGLQQLRNKERIDTVFVMNADPSDVNRFDRGAARNIDTSAGALSDLTLYGSILLPVALVLDKDIRSDALKIGALYLETMAVMANAYTWGVSFTKRPRPYVYDNSGNTSFEKRTGRGALNSFYAGHPAAAAASTFFAAKVFADYHPESKLRPVLYGAAVLPPAAVAYFRYKNGQHFPTDILVGIPLGAGVGILIPQLHKKSNKTNLSITPITGPYNGLVFDYRF